MATNIQPICEGINWIDVTNPTQQEMQQLSEEYHLNQHTVRDCLQPEHLPKYESVEDVHFLILRYNAHSFDKQLATIQDITNKIAIFYTGQFLISIHLAEISFLDVLRKKYVSNNKCSSVTDLLTRITWNVLETFEEPAGRLTEKVEFYEAQTMMKKVEGDLMDSLYLIKREASIAHKTLMLMVEPINHILVKPGEESALQDVRDQHLKMRTLYTQVLDDVNNLMNLNMSYSSQRTNEVMKVLTMFSVFFMPLTFIAGIYGMNFEYMPELTRKWGYPAVLFVMLIIAGIIYFWFKRKKWL
jgi:magnesium transporter